MKIPAFLLASVLSAHVTAQTPPPPKPPVVQPAESGKSERPTTDPQEKAKAENPSVTFHVVGMMKTASGAT